MQSRIITNNLSAAYPAENMESQLRHEYLHLSAAYPAENLS